MPPIAGGLAIQALSWGTGTVSVSTVGSAGFTSYSYVVCAEVANGLCAPSVNSTVATGNARLGTVNYNRITWYPVPGAAEYCVYRSASAGTPSTTGLLANGCMSASSNSVNSNFQYSFLDRGLTADSTATPTVNTADGRGHRADVPDHIEHAREFIRSLHAWSVVGRCQLRIRLHRGEHDQARNPKRIL